jgi:signal transduction histidine kinase
MFAARDLSSVRLPEFTRTTTFRWTLLVSGAFALCILLMFAFVYWQTSVFMIARVDSLITQDIGLIASESSAQRLEAIEERLRQDPRRVRLAGLFGADRRPIAGNLEVLPPDLQIDSVVHSVNVVRLDNRGREQQTIRAVARSLSDGGVVVLGRNIDEFAEIGTIVERALVLGLIPALCLGLLSGVLLSVRVQQRVEEVNRRVQRIVAGELRQRLPTRGLDDAFDKLAVIVNGMLDEMEALIIGIRGVGDDIAHDLRTPLTRVRVSLERGRENAQTLPDLRAVVDRAISGLDQSLGIITALLRIAEIEQSRRLSGFGKVALTDLVREVGDLYEPIAEDKHVAFEVVAHVEAFVYGDRDLLFEAVANLVDNALKFTPEGGRVELSLVLVGEDGIVRVRDTGPGISENEREVVGRRFYRSDKSRHTQGLGLGLSLVTAIVKLHGFRFSISAGSGCVAEIACKLAPD